MQVLINSGASTTVLDESGNSLLQIAVESRILSAKRFLDAFDIDKAGNSELNLAEGSQFWEGLRIDANYPDIIRQLLDLGADLGIKDSKGRTVLHLAAHDASRVKALLKHGAQKLDINARDSNGSSALHQAAFHGAHEAIEALLANGADANSKGFDGSSMLECAITYSVIVRVQTEGGSLADERCILRAHGFWRRTALHYLEKMETVPEEARAQLHRASLDPTEFHSQDTTASEYLNNDDFSDQAIQDKLRWIEMQPLEKASMLQRDSTLFILRISRAQEQRRIVYAY